MKNVNAASDLITNFNQEGLYLMIPLMTDHDSQKEDPAFGNTKTTIVDETLLVYS